MWPVAFASALLVTAATVGIHNERHRNRVRQLPQQQREQQKQQQKHQQEQLVVQSRVGYRPSPRKLNGERIFLGDAELEDWFVQHMEELREKYELLIAYQVHVAAIDFGPESSLYYVERTERPVEGIWGVVHIRDPLPRLTEPSGSTAFQTAWTEQPNTPFGGPNWVSRGPPAFGGGCGAMWRSVTTPDSLQVKCRIVGRKPQPKSQFLDDIFFRLNATIVPTPILQLICDYVGPGSIITEPTWVPLNAWFGDRSCCYDDNRLKQTLLSSDIQQP